MNKSLHEIGIVGLGVMGLNLARNMISKGIHVVGYDTNTDRTAEAGEHKISTTHSLEDFITSLELPRRILIMVPAGEAVAAVISSISPFLERGDSLVDGGNSYFKDTATRQKELASMGVHYMGLGISGGRKGALEGPGLMAGGSQEAYSLWEPFLKNISAKFEDQACIAYLGSGGAGHYVKMVHNGIEYGMMQSLADAYSILKIGAGRSNTEIARIFQEWDEGELGGYLTSITSKICKKTNPAGTYFIDEIRDAAAQKGTGNWTAQDSLELGIPIPGIDAAIRERQISSHLSERQQLGATRKRELPRPTFEYYASEAILGNAIHAAQMLIYVQGFHLLMKAKEVYGFSYDLSEVARIWRGGCIISSKIVEFLASAQLDNANHPLLVPEVAKAIRKNIGTLKNITSLANIFWLSFPSLSSNFNYWLSFYNTNMSTNLIQAQRDYFGGHGLETISGRKTNINWEEPTN